MKRLIIILSGLLLTMASATAQIAINTDGSAADASAILDVSSTTKGMLIPRLTRVQIEALSSPANGLLVFNTDDGKFYIYITAKGVWREVEYASGTVVAPGSFTMTCSSFVVNGTYASGVALDATNNVTLDVDVTATGDWSITTNTVNGYQYDGGGTFTSTGTQQVSLTGTGTPTAGETDTFTATASNGGGTCTFDVTVVAAVTNATTGRIWMDRNLGASQVATSSTDANAYGDYYQWGRLADGHEKSTSGTTSTLSSTDDPNNGGLFITVSNSPYDWRDPQNDNLWQGVSGINNPCPSGFRLATETEWTDEMNTWATQDADGAYGSELKLTLAGYRDYSDASMNSLGSHGWYWDSTVSSTDASELSFTSSSASMSHDPRGYGQSVRCIKD